MIEDRSAAVMSQPRVPEVVEIGWERPPCSQGGILEVSREKMCDVHIMYYKI